MATTTAIELQQVDAESPQSPYDDPLQLSSAIKSPAEIKELVSGTYSHSRLPFSARSAHGVSTTSVQNLPKKKRKTVKALQSFYESQNAHIQRMLKPVDDHRKEAKDEQGDTRLRFLIAVHGSLVANVLLAVLQAYAAISSKSLSIFASVLPFL
jgi:predicted RNA-binding Zn ribbon-like protein